LQSGLTVTDVHMSFDTGAEQPVEVLRGASLQVDPGQTVAITGPSGSGKSTLLHLIGTLERPQQGGIVIQGKDTASLTEPELARFRNDTIGFVFQEHHLLPQYSVIENVLVPRLAYARRDGAEDRARTLLDRVGLSHRLTHRPAELSGGERQRAAVARALINKPGLLLCDEPTGSLDGQTADTVATLLFELQAEENNILIIVTHSPELAARCGRRVELREGRCIEP
jgi:lipoprotein-releasing system ATP-binding protein